MKWDESWRILTCRPAYVFLCPARITGLSCGDNRDLNDMTK